MWEEADFQETLGENAPPATGEQGLQMAACLLSRAPIRLFSIAHKEPARGSCARALEAAASASAAAAALIAPRQVCVRVRTRIQSLGPLLL